MSPNQKIVDGSRRTLQKALALSALELPVGDMVTSVVESHHDIPQEVFSLLLANAQDEVKHDQALNNLKKVLPPTPEDIKFMDDIVSRAKELANEYSPITVAGVLEASLFFVVLPMYRFLGGGGFRTVANDISNDENIHVATNVNLAKDLGWERGYKLNSLRIAVMEWLVDDLKWKNETNKYLSGEFWWNSSSSLYAAGKAPQLAETRRYVMPAFFEKSNDDLARYA